MKNLLLLATMILLIGAIGCSSAFSEPVTPVEQAGRDASLTSSHQLWGLWRMIVNPDEGTIDVIPLRGAEMHVNVLPFLEPPALVNLTLESLFIDIGNNSIAADVGLRHPFLGLNEFTGFDVCGILISNGSVGGFSDPDLLLPGPADFRLLNPDGHTRWWNPAEFPINTGTMFGYNDGFLGAPDSYANYSATLNGYKYFCDDLTNPDDPLSAVDPMGRGVFSAGQKNVRQYLIDMGDTGLIFNYAVDASWKFPDGDPPYDIPDSFPPEANRPEAWDISYTVVENTLFNDGAEYGGDLSLDIHVYDWYNADLNTVSVESPGNFVITESSTATGGGPGYSTYTIEITDATPVPDEIQMLCSVGCEYTGYGGILVDEVIKNYSIFTIPVTDEQVGGIPEDPVVVHEIITDLGICDDVATQGNYLYLADRYGGLKIIDITDPESAFIVNTVDPGSPTSQALSVAISGEYAYLGDYSFGLHVIDIDPPGSAYTLASVASGIFGTKNVAPIGGYAYVVHYTNGLQIYDVDPPASSFLDDTISMSSYADDIAISGGYAYVSSYTNNTYGELNIFDIDPPGSATLVGTLPMASSWSVVVEGDYAYVGHRPSGDVSIVDVSTPTLPSIVTTVDTPGYYTQLCVSDGYAYVTGDNYPATDGTLQVVDIDPPATAYIFSSVAITGRPFAVAVSDNYAYLACYNAGLQIVKLW